MDAEWTRFAWRRGALAMAALAIAGGAGGATAREIEVGIPALRLRTDATFRYNLGVRTDPVDEKISASPVFTEGENSVSQGGITMNRLDLLLEMDAVYEERLGARVSAAGWYDDAYRSGTVTRDPSLAAIPGTYLGNELSTYALRRYHGPWGELLDAFAFATLDAGGVPVTVKAGRHALYWGESLMLAGAVHGVGYAQSPLDLQKGFATPGIEAKELYRPLASVSAQAQLTPTLSIAAQAFLEWQSYLYPEGATFVGAGDFAFNGPDGLSRTINGTPSYLVNGGVRRPSTLGDLGVGVRWAPEWLDGTAGLYYRRFTDKLAAVLITSNAGGNAPLGPSVASPFRYDQYYGEGIDLIGASLAKQVLGVSVGLDASYRHDMPLLAPSLGYAVAPSPQQAALLFPHGAPQLVGNSYQARGDTLHGVLNAVGILAGLPAFSSAAWAVELTYSRWLSVGRNPDLFYGEGYGVCRTDAALSQAGQARTWRDGCATRDHFAMGAGFTPTWFRVLPGVDLLAPLFVSWTIVGNSPVMLGGNQASGNFAVGLAADVRNRYRFDLRYADYFGRTNDNGTIVTSANGQVALLKSRASVTLTAKATF